MVFLCGLWGSINRNSSLLSNGVRAFSTTRNTNMALTRAVGKSYVFARSNRMSNVDFLPPAGTSSTSKSKRTFSTNGSTESDVYAKSGVARQLSSSSNLLEDDVDLELDSALDDLLSGREVGASKAEDDEDFDDFYEEGTEEEDDDEEEEDLDYKDGELRSITNQYWIDAGLPDVVIQSLSEKGISKFTPVQAEAFKPVLKGRDVIGRSRTGTGKTLAFGIPSILRLDKAVEKDSRGRRMRGRNPSMIVLCPTRELARQVHEELNYIAKPLGLYTDVFHGGVSYDPQSRSLRQGIDILVGTPGRIMDHKNRGTLDLSDCKISVLDEADEMLNMGFAEDVEDILDGIGSNNISKTQCLLFSATTPPWVKEIGSQYQTGDVKMIDATSEQGGARTATTVRHTAIQVPPGHNSKKSILEDIISVEISKESKDANEDHHDDDNEIAQAALEKKKKSHGALQQKIFGKTIVFTDTKRDADELVSGGVFKSLTAQALHGDVGQKQRDATLKAFRNGAFNVLVATDVAARGIDIQDVDLVVQYSPPRDTDTYVHRSGRTGRAGNKGISVLLFEPRQSRDIVRIERSLGHGFKFELVGPPSIEAALKAAARTSALALAGVPEGTSKFFMDAAENLLEEDEDPVEVVARCLAAISRRSTEVVSRSLLTGEEGLLTVKMSNKRGRTITPGDVMFTVGKLSRMSKKDSDDLAFDSDVGKIQMNEEGNALFDLGAEDAKNLLEFSKDIDAGGAVFEILTEIGIERGRNFGSHYGGGGRGRGGGRWGNNGGRGGRGGYNRSGSYGRGGGGRGRYDGGRGGRGGGRNRYDSRGNSGGRFNRSSYGNRGNGGGGGDW